MMVGQLVVQLVRPDPLPNASRRCWKASPRCKAAFLFAIVRLDFVRDTANLKIYYDDSKQGDWLNAAEPVAVKDDGSDL